MLAGRSAPSRRAGWWRSPPRRHLPVFAFVVGVASLGLFVFMVAPPRRRPGGSDLAEPLLDGEAAAPVVCLLPCARLGWRDLEASVCPDLP